MSALQRTSTAKVMPTFPRLEGDPPRPPSPSTKPTVPLYNRPQTPTTWAAKGGAGNGAAMTSFAERTAAPKAYLKTAGAINSSGFNSPTASSVVNSTPVATQVESVVGRTSISTRPPLEIDEIVKESVVHGVAGESLRQAKKLRSQPELGKKRSNYFDETVPEPPATAPLQEAFRQNDGIIVAELVTNVFINDDWTICHDIAQFVGRRYDRDAKDVMVSVQHGICYFFQGCFSPAYVLTLSLQPGDVSPACNRRNAAVLQAQMHEALGVHPQRGVIKFVAVPDDGLAWNGMTVTAAMAPEMRGSMRDAWDTARARRRLSVKSLSALRSRAQTPTPIGDSSPPPIPGLTRQQTNNNTHNSNNSTGYVTATTNETADTSIDEQSRPSSASTGKGVAVDVDVHQRPQPALRQLKNKKSFVANLFSRRAVSKAEKAD